MGAVPDDRGDAWGLLVALTLLNILNFADRYLVIAFSTRIIPDLGLSNLQFGVLTGIVFTLVYTIVGLFLGSLADRVRRPRLIAGGLALWSALTALTGVARSFGQMAAARMFVGVGEAALTPAALSMLGDTFAPGRRALANGIYYLGIPVGIGSSFILAGILGPHLGWRGSFVALGVLGLVASLAVAAWMRDPRRGPAAVGGAGIAHGSFAHSFRGLAREVRHNGAFSTTLVGCILATFVQGATVLDLVWWVRERGYPEGVAQHLNGSLFLAGGVFGSLAGGIAADWFERRGAGGRLRFLGWTFVVGIPLMLLFRTIPGQTPAFLALAFLANAVFMLVYGPALAALHELVPAAHRAASVALFILCTSLIGSSGGAAVVGWLADTYTRAGHAEPLSQAILVTQAFGLLAIPAFLLAAQLQARRARAAAAAG